MLLQYLRSCKASWLLLEPPSIALNLSLPFSLNALHILSRQTHSLPLLPSARQWPLPNLVCSLEWPHSFHQILLPFCFETLQGVSPLPYSLARFFSNCPHHSSTPWVPNRHPSLGAQVLHGAQTIPRVFRWLCCRCCVFSPKLFYLFQNNCKCFQSRDHMYSFPWDISQ